MGLAAPEEDDELDEYEDAEAGPEGAVRDDADGAADEAVRGDSTEDAEDRPTTEVVYLGGGDTGGVVESDDSGGLPEGDAVSEPVHSIP